MEKSEMVIRGIHGGVLITLPSLPWYQQRDLLIRRIQTQERFFKGGRIALDVGISDWTEQQLHKLLKDLSDEGVCLWTILSSSEQTLAAADYHGLPTSLPDPKRTREKAAVKNMADTTGFTMLNRSLKPAEIWQNEGNLLMIGDVPAHSKLIVTGSLVLWGTLAGEVNVGEAGKEESLNFLKYNKGKIILNGSAVEIPRKEHKNFAFEVKFSEGSIDLKSSQHGGLRLR